VNGGGAGAIAIEARRLSKQFVLIHNRGYSIKSRVVGLLNARHRERLEPFWALRDVSISIGRGEQVGLVGRNGSGKSTLLKLIAGIHRPTSGHLLIERGATIGTMIELGVGFHPDLTGTENVFLSAAIHGRSRAEIEAMYPRIVEYSGLSHFMDVALKNYSSGMHMRLGFAVAATLDPDILLLDEVFAVGDEDFQKKCMRTMNELASEGRTIVFVSHTASAVRKMCRRVCVLDDGRLRFDGDVESGLSEYQQLLLEPPSPKSNSPVDASDPQSEVADLALGARRRIAAFGLELLHTGKLETRERVIELGIEPAVDPGSPILQHTGPARYAYWQAGWPSPPDLTQSDVAVAASVFLHFPLNTIARIIATALRDMRPGARLYATFYEVSADRTFDPTPWAGGYTTHPEAAPYQYSFGLIEGVVSALGGRVERVAGVAHPNGESVIVITSAARQTR
jgi:ABC-type polysaccharide/polyol phosphate transport system ATPase subunit